MRLAVVALAALGVLGEGLWIASLWILRDDLDWSVGKPTETNRVKRIARWFSPEVNIPHPPPLPAPKRRPTRSDVDALFGAATPHFAYQLRARLRELVADLPDDDDVRRYAEFKMELLDQLGHATSKAEFEAHKRPSGAQ